MSRVAGHARPREGGFSLIETLIALAIIAGMTAMTFDTLGTDGRLTRQMRARRHAVMIAQSQLAQAVIGGGPERGTVDGFAWRMARSPYGGAGDGRARLERVSVEVQDPSNARALVTLQTLALRP